jgi:predicted transcriptional regulator
MKADIELVTRHIEVLRAVIEYQPIGIMKLGELLSLPQHRIRYSLRILEQNGYIQASSSGAVATPAAMALFSTLDDDIADIIGLLTRIRSSPGSP